jgi:hypothetical protein
MRNMEEEHNTGKANVLSCSMEISTKGKSDRTAWD